MFSYHPMNTIGEELKQAREARKLTIAKVVQGTRLRQHYIEALEADDYESMPSPVQGRGFLRLYANFLGLDAEALVERQRTGNIPPSAPVQVDETHPAPTPDPVTETELETEPEPELEPLPLPTPAPAPELRLSHSIFREIGVQLQQRRELLGLTLVEIERHTHVRQHYLSAIEQGEFDQLPSPVQARGMLSAYARFLDMDADAMLLRFADGLQSRRIENQPDPEQKRKSKNSRPRVPLWLKQFVSPDLVFGGVMIFLIIGMVLWGSVRLLEGNETSAEATEGPSISDVILATPSLEAGITPQAFATSLEEIAPLVIAGEAEVTLETNLDAPNAVKVTVIVLERTFLRVIVDGEIKNDGRVVPGAALTFDGDAQIEVLTGNGAAVQIIYNQADLGRMGTFGEVVNRIYTVEGIQTPTPTITPTATNTPRVRPSETPTLTPTISLTESMTVP